LGAVLATHAALAFAAVDTQGQFYSALASRDHIGQAKGILMERFDVDSVQAFGMLRKMSQDTNTPLRDVAKRMTDT
jgi:AmiR/NasT family two-component response regulator